MLVLMMTAFGSYPIPAVVLNELNEVSYLHASTIVPMQRAVKFFATHPGVKEPLRFRRLLRNNPEGRKCPGDSFELR